MPLDWLLRVPHGRCAAWARLAEVHTVVGSERRKGKIKGAVGVSHT